MTPMTMDAGELRAGDWVRVRDLDEILATLDADGRYEGMPFMPEMVRYCGRRFRVSRSAHKTCDPVNGLEGRRLPRAVHLEDLRCDGANHAGCQAGCLLFWKTAWLRAEPLDAAGAEPARHVAGDASMPSLLDNATLSARPAADGSPIYVCQATCVGSATTPIKWWDATQYVEDYRTGNASLGRIASAFVFFVYNNACGAGLGFGTPLRWLYDTVQGARGAAPYPWRFGHVPRGRRTPFAQDAIAEGDIVETKSYGEILETLDENWRNRGLYFDAEMVPFTGGKRFRVLKRVDRIVDEKTGRLLVFKHPCLILDGVACEARYAKCRKLCPRGYYLYWRDIWVRKVESAA